jgi:hypothetical protein
VCVSVHASVHVYVPVWRKNGKMEVNRYVCMIAGFSHNCAPLYYYAANNGPFFLPMSRYNWDFLPQKMGPVGCPEMLVGSYCCLLCNNPEEHSSQQTCLFSLHFSIKLQCRWVNTV